MKYTKKTLDKKDFSTLLVVTILLHIFGIHITNYNYFNIMIELGTILIISLIVFLSTFRKNLSEKKINWLWGITGLINAFVFALLFSFSFNVSLKVQILICIFSSLVLLLVFVILKLIYNYSKKLYQQKKDMEKSSSYIVILGVVGSIIGVYISQTNVLSVVRRDSLIFGLASLLFSFFSLFLFKSKDCS